MTYFYNWRSIKWSVNLVDLESRIRDQSKKTLRALRCVLDILCIRQRQMQANRCIYFHITFKTQRIEDVKRACIFKIPLSLALHQRIFCHGPFNVSNIFYIGSRCEPSEKKMKRIASLYNQSSMQFFKGKQSTFRADSRAENGIMEVAFCDP